MVTLMLIILIILLIRIMATIPTLMMNIFIVLVMMTDHDANIDITSKHNNPSDNII